MKNILRLLTKRRSRYKPEELFSAVSTGEYDLVKPIVESCTDLNVTFRSRTPLYISICRNYVDIVELLINKGADVNQLCNNSLHLPESPIIAASRLNLYDCVHVLVKAPGIQINCTDLFGAGALYYAVRNNNIAMISLLLRHNAIINAGMHFFDFSVFYFQEDFKEQIDVIYLLLQRGCTIEHLPYYKLSFPCILHHAIRNGKEKTVKLLFYSGYRGTVVENMHLLRETQKINAEFYEWLQDILKNPLSLKNVTRISIRQALALRCGSLKTEYINKLPVPQKLKNFIWLLD